jgi:polyhydroxybutyrate depolymerase
VDDVAFVRDLLDEIEARYCIDPKRVYATGMSNGGFLSHRLACEVSDRIAAVAPVAGVLGIPPESCNPGRPVPVLHFHGTADPMVPYTGGTPLIPQLGVGIVFRSVANTMSHWRSKNACSGFEKTFYANGDATCVEWPDCAMGAQTALCTIDGGGHTWPGGVPIPAGKTSTDIDATATMLEFFAAHPLP